MGIEHKRKVFEHNKGFTTLDSRIRSFDRCTRTLHLSVRDYCEAGFYYIGKITFKLFFSRVNIFILVF